MNTFTKIRQKISKRENYISVIFFIITMIIATSPLVSRYCINGHDIDYHLLRIESLKEGILIGKPFLKVNTLFFGGAGYASSMFYSDLFLYFPALLRVLGVSIGKSYHLFVASIFALCYLTTYYSVYKMSVSKYAASIAAIIMTLCPYHMDDMLLRAACGEYCALVFVPLAIYGIYNVIFEEMDNPWAFGIGFGGLILTHPATCIMCVAFGILVFVIFIDRLIKDPSIVLKLVAVCATVMAATAFYWVPMCEQFATTSFYVSDNWSDMLDSALNFSAVFSKTFPCLGFLLIAFMLPRFTLRKKDYPILSYVDAMLAASLLFVIGSTNIVPWEIIGKYFSFLQFPWRFLLMSSTLLAISDAIILKIFIERIGDNKKEFICDFMLVAVLALFAATAFERFSQESFEYYDYGDDYYSFKPYTVNVIGGEWLPKTVTDRDMLVAQSGFMIFDESFTEEFTRQRATITRDIDESHNYADVPFIYYKGYAAYLTDDEGNKTKLEVTGEGYNGMCRVYLNGQTGHLSVLYKSTVLQIVSYVISAVTILALFALWFFEYRNKKKLRINAQKAGAVIGTTLTVILLPIGLMTLSGCSSPLSQTVLDAGEKSGNPYSGLASPEEMVDYLKSKDEEQEKEEEALKEQEIKNLTTVNICKKGYESGKEGAKGFAVKIDESTGEQVISLISPQEGKEACPDDFYEKESLYELLISKEIEHIKTADAGMNELIMNEADMLLCLEILPDKKGTADMRNTALSIADRIFEKKDECKNLTDKYNVAAILTKAAFVLDEWEKGDDALNFARDLFDEAEGTSDIESEPASSRVFAAAELYRMTGLKTYRSVVDATLMDLVPEGFSYENPGYYGLFTYLISENPGNYNVSTGMMDYIFSKANAIIKEDFENEILSVRIDDKLRDNEEKLIRENLEKAKIVAIADYISVCVEYEKYIENVLCYTCGANLSGTDYTEEGEILEFEPLYLMYGSLIEK